MNARRLTARFIGITAFALLITIMSAGPYLKSGWLGVAGMWIGIAILFGLCRAIIWSAEHWKARP